MTKIPSQYKWIEKEQGPRVIVEALKEFGTVETPGPKSNPVIIGWAKEVGQKVGIQYSDDAVPWCGLFVGLIVKRAGFDPVAVCVRAKEWLNFGTKQKRGEFGDIAILEREGGGHVGFVVGQSLDGKATLLLGGNQSDAVSFAWVETSRIIGFRRCPWKLAQPKQVRPIILNRTGSLSVNEA